MKAAHRHKKAVPTGTAREARSAAVFLHNVMSMIPPLQRLSDGRTSSLGYAPSGAAGHASPPDVVPAAGAQALKPENRHTAAVWHKSHHALLAEEHNAACLCITIHPLPAARDLYAFASACLDRSPPLRHIFKKIPHQESKCPRPPLPTPRLPCLAQPGHLPA